MPTPLYPATEAWLKSIYPAGLEAFPQCRCSTRLPLIIAQDYPKLSQLPGLPPLCREALAQPMVENGWVPETVAVLQQLLLRDALFADDATFFEATRQRVKKSFSHPAIRPLMAVMSPHLLILGAGRRWAAYHQGTTLSVTSKSAHSLVGTLSFPPGLFPPLMIEDTRVAIQASIELTNKQIRTLTAEVTAPGVCALAGSWQ